MAQKIGIVSYPDNITAIMADRKLGVAFRAFVKSQLADENTRFLDANYDPRMLYKNFLKPGSKWEINISGDLRAQAIKLGDVSDWKNKAWKNIIRDGQSVCLRLLDRNFLSRFWDSKEFLEHHRKAAEARMKGDPRKAASLLGISDVKTLRELTIAIAAGFDREAKKLSDKLVKAEKLKMRADVLLKELRRAGFA